MNAVNVTDMVLMKMPVIVMVIKKIVLEYAAVNLK